MRCLIWVRWQTFFKHFGCTGHMPLNKYLFDKASSAQKPTNHNQSIEDIAKRAHSTDDTRVGIYFQEPWHVLRIIRFQNLLAVHYHVSS